MEWYDNPFIWIAILIVWTTVANLIVIIGEACRWLKKGYWEK